MDDEIFRVHAIVNEIEYVLPIGGRLINAYMQFVDYIRNEAGAPIGIKVLCDCGHGYGFNDGEKELSLYPHRDYSFQHSYTSTTDGTWENDWFDVAVRLLPIEEAPECSYGRRAKIAGRFSD